MLVDRRFAVTRVRSYGSNGAGGEGEKKKVTNEESSSWEAACTSFWICFGFLQTLGLVSRLSPSSGVINMHDTRRIGWLWHLVLGVSLPLSPLSCSSFIRKVPQVLMVKAEQWITALLFFFFFSRSYKLGSAGVWACGQDGLAWLVPFHLIIVDSMHVQLSNADFVLSLHDDMAWSRFVMRV